MLLGKGLDAITVVIILELVLAVYSIALVFNADNKILKITHIVLTLFWTALALLNIFCR